MNTYETFSDGTPAGLAAAVIAQAWREDPGWFRRCPDEVDWWLAWTDLDPDTFWRHAVERLRRSA